MAYKYRQDKNTCIACGIRGKFDLFQCGYLCNNCFKFLYPKLIEDAKQ